jgi:hypothetical protein
MNCVGRGKRVNTGEKEEGVCTSLPSNNYVVFD